MPKQMTKEQKAELERKVADANSMIDDMDKDFNQSFANAGIAKKSAVTRA